MNSDSERLQINMYLEMSSHRVICCSVRLLFLGDRMWLIRNSFYILSCRVVYKTDNALFIFRILYMNVTDEHC